MAGPMGAYVCVCLCVKPVYLDVKFTLNKQTDMWIVSGYGQLSSGSNDILQTGNLLVYI